MTDALTGLPTHNDGLKEALGRHQGSFACLADIDGFIWLNDQQGHVEGDRVLADIASHLRRLSEESSGSVFRVGGDEFLLLLPGLSLGAVLEVASTIVDRVHTLQLPYRRLDRPNRVTLEVNVVVLAVSAAFADGAIAQFGLSDSVRDWIGEQLYREKVRLGREAGLVVDLSSGRDSPWARS